MLILFVSAVNSNNIHKQILFCISVFWQKSVFWEWCNLQRISFEWHWWTLIQIYSHQMVCWKGEFNFNLALTNLLNTLPVVIEFFFWWLLFLNNTVQYKVYPVYFISFCYVVSGMSVLLQFIPKPHLIGCTSLIKKMHLWSLNETI